MSTRLHEAQIAARSKMYVGSAREAFERAKTRAVGIVELPAYPGDGKTACLTRCRCEWVCEEVEGGWECYWVLDPAAEHCQDCLDNAAKWNPLHVGPSGVAVEAYAEGGPGSGHHGHKGTPGSRGGSLPSSLAAFSSAPEATFAAALSKNTPEKYRAFVTVHSTEQYKEMKAKTYLSESGKTGFAVKPDGDIISVFSSEGKGKEALAMAIKSEGTKLDCFDGFLPGFYAKFGFHEHGRLKWDDQYKPKGWDTRKFDHPDVVLMELRQ